MNAVLRAALSGGAERLAAAGISSARLDARVLIAHAMNIAPENIFSAQEPSADELRRFENNIARRLSFEPVAYITGRKEFWGLAFAVGPGALIPRPETETLLEEARRFFPNEQSELTVLDLGTGSGCLLISFLRDYPRARGTGVDRSEEALRWARANAKRLGVSSHARLVNGDWAAGGTGYDVILANPPYVATGEIEGLSPEILRYEPLGALDGGPDGLGAYRALAPVLANALNPKGRAFLELGAGQAEKLSSIVNGEGLEIVRLAPDLAGVPRCAVVARKA